MVSRACCYLAVIKATIQFIAVNVPNVSMVKLYR